MGRRSEWCSVRCRSSRGWKGQEGAGRGRKAPPRSLGTGCGGSLAPPHLGFDLWPQDLERRIFCCFNPVSLHARCFLSAAPGSEVPHSAVSGDDLSGRSPVGSQQPETFLPTTPALGRVSLAPGRRPGRPSCGAGREGASWTRAPGALCERRAWPRRGRPAGCHPVRQAAGEARPAEAASEPVSLSPEGPRPQAGGSQAASARDLTSEGPRFCSEFCRAPQSGFSGVSSGLHCGEHSAV